MFNWFRNRRRRRLLRQDVPSEWSAWIERYVWQHKQMCARHRVRMDDVVRVLVAEKHWTGCGGFEMTDEARVAIAAQAALLVLGPKEPYYFDRLQSILVYPQAYRAEAADSSQLLLGDGVSDRLSNHWGGPPRDDRLGESWRGGPIILSWEAIQHEAAHPRQGTNLVLHEFAHHLDSLNGDTDGVPPMFHSHERRRWQSVVEKEYHRLVRSARNRQPTLLDQYGAANRAEFFAVATECFFERPHELRAQHQQLYKVLAGFYQQSPAEWLAPRSSA